MIDPVSPTTLYAVGSFNPYDPALQGPGLFKSTDGGGTWNRIHESLVGPAIDPVTPTTIYAADTGRVFRSTDAGAKWAVVGSTDVSVKAFAIDPVTPTTLYGLGAATIIKSTDGGTTWSPTSLGFGPPNYFVHPFAIDPVTPTTLYAGTEAGMRKSTDGGITWSAPGAPPPPPPPPDTSPPDTSIISAADGTGTALTNNAITLSTSLTLSFTGTDNVGLSRLECKLDAAGFSVCTSPPSRSTP